MSQDIHHFLKDSGYLDSPGQRLFWKGATPSLRGHFRQLGLLSLLACAPPALLLSFLCHLRYDSDRLILMLVYMFLAVLVLLSLDLLLTLLIRSPRMQNLFVRKNVLNGLPVLLSALFLLTGTQWLNDAIMLRTGVNQVIAWAALTATALLMAVAPRYLIISRLYWHGLKPPTYRAHGILTLTALVLVFSFHFSSSWLGNSRPNLAPKPGQAVVVLAFDVPQGYQDIYASHLPTWNQQTFKAQESRITDFWASLGTGTSDQYHRSSLFQYKTPLFLEKLSKSDPTLTPVLSILQWLNAAEPMAGGGRYRKYFWEVLDEYGLTSYAFSYWHTFPASSQHGGVLSERWEPSLSMTPYIAGLKPLNGVKTMPLHGEPAIRSIIHRENQTWAQLQLQASNNSLQFSIAYFPLSDHFDKLSEDEQLARHQHLARFRGEMLDKFLKQLDPDVAVAMVVSPGKNAPLDGQLVTMKTNQEWRSRLAEHMDSYQQIAPTILNYFGLPADYLMYPTAYPDPPPSRRVRIDYGEPKYPGNPNDHEDSRYYLQLKSLGYIQ